MIKAIIFDMDGLLIDSEPLWEESEIKIFSKVGLTLTKEMTKKTMGLRIDEVVDYWYNKHPWETKSKKAVETEIIKNVTYLIKMKGGPLEGAIATIKLLNKKGFALAIASSSPTNVINTVLEKLNITKYFSVIQSAEYEVYGKPHPGVYISAAKKMKVDPANCLAFEDSPNGILAAKAAKMRCIAVPNPKIKTDKRFCVADKILKSLADFDLAVLDNITE